MILQAICVCLFSMLSSDPEGDLSHRWREVLLGITIMRETAMLINNLLHWESKWNLQCVLKILSF